MPFIDPLNLITPYGMSKIAIPYNKPIQTIRRVGRLRPTVKFRKIKYVVKNPYFHLISFALLNSFSSRRSPLKYLYRHIKKPSSDEEGGARSVTEGEKILKNSIFTLLPHSHFYKMTVGTVI